MRYIIKHLSIALSIVLIIASFIPLHVFAESTPIITGSTVDAQIGEKVEITFDISNAEEVCGGNFNVVYDSEYLQVVSAKAGAVFSNSTPVINTKYDTGKIRMTWAGLSPIESDGEIIRIEFLVKDDVPSGILNVGIENLKLYDLNTESITSKTNDAEIEVKNTYLSLQPENNGENISVSIQVSGDTIFQGGNYTLLYDNTALEPVSVGKGTLLSGTTISYNLEYASNAIRVSWAGVDSVTEKGEVCKVIFKAKEGYTGNVAFELKDVKLYDENGEPLVVQTERAEFVIENIDGQNPHILIDTVKYENEGFLSVSISENSLLCGGGIEVKYDNTLVRVFLKSSTEFTSSSDLTKITLKTTEGEEFVVEYTTFDNFYDKIAVSGVANGMVTITLSDGNIIVEGAKSITGTATVSDSEVSASANIASGKIATVIVTNNDNGKAELQILSSGSALTDKVVLAIRQQVSMPDYDLENGSYDEGQILTLTGDSEALIYYTTDGSEPTVEDGMLYTLPIEINKSMMVKAIAVKYGYTNSDTLVLKYTLPETSMPYSQQESGEYDNTIYAELEVNDDSAEVYYTIDGSDPIENGILYTTPIVLKEDTVLKACSVKNGCVSNIVEYEYSINLSESGDFLFGDIYKDSNVNSKDAIKLSQYLAKWNIAFDQDAKNSADVFYDGAVNSKDAIKLGQYIAKWNVTLGK